HQIGTDFLARLARSGPANGLDIRDRELASAPIVSEDGQAYLGAMRAAINGALANRQVVGALVRRVFSRRVPEARLSLLYDVSHHTCKGEEIGRGAWRERGWG